MNWYSYIAKHIIFLTWRDSVEILFFAATFYAIILWLKKDNDKKLLPYFYGYCAITFLTHTMQLATVTYCLFFFSPAIIMLFMFMHQDTLQRNMVSLKNITAETPTAHDWLSCIMRNTLKALHDNKDMLILIEHTDSLASYLKTKYTITTPITDDVMTLLMENNLCNTQRMVWIKSDGTIQGIHVAWKASWHPAAYTGTKEWIDDAIAYTAKTDALIMYSNAKKQQYTIAYQGAITEGLTVEQSSQLIRKHTNAPIPVTKKGFNHESTNSKNKQAQRSS